MTGQKDNIKIMISVNGEDVYYFNIDTNGITDNVYDVANDFKDGIHYEWNEHPLTSGEFRSIGLRWIGRD